MEESKPVKVVILCGGRGTRLVEETEYRPKPMVRIGPRPILTHIMDIYSAFGFREFILTLGFKGEMIKDYFLNFDYYTNDFTIDLGEGKVITPHTRRHPDWRITLADTGESTLTGGRIKRITSTATPLWSPTGTGSATSISPGSSPTTGRWGSWPP